MGIPLLDRVRLQWIDNIAHTMNVRAADRSLQVRYRARNAAVWKDVSPDEAIFFNGPSWASQFERHHAGEADRDGAVDEASREIQNMLNEQHVDKSTKTYRSARNNAAYASEVSTALQNVMQSVAPLAPPRDGNGPVGDVDQAQQRSQAVFLCDADRLNYIMQGIRAPPQDVPLLAEPAGAQPQQNQPPPLHAGQRNLNAQERDNEFDNLSPEQASFVQEISGYAAALQAWRADRSGTRPRPPRVVLLGPPGTWDTTVLVVLA